MKREALFLSFLLLGCICTLPAQTIYVDHQADGNDDGTDWTNAYTDLQSAIDNAPVEAAIWLAAGTYTPGERSQSFLIDRSLHLYGGFGGNETQLADRNLEENITILSGDNLGDDPADNPNGNRTDNSIHIVQLLADSKGGSLNEITISGGYGEQEAMLADTDGYGGGIYNLASAFQFNNCVFRANSSRGGGAFANRTPNTEGLVFANCLFEDNVAEDGGAILSSESGAKISISECRFLNNSAAGYTFSSGGAIWGGSDLEISISQTLFENNTALNTGGAIALFNDPVATFTDLTFRSNHTEAGNGGALNIENRGTVSITATHFEQNQSAGNGGAASFDLAEPYRLQITSTEFRNNEAARNGGAVFADGQFIMDRMAISESVFTSNSCSGTGGAVRVSGGPLQIKDSHFEKNDAGSGGAVSTLLNSVILDVTNCDFIENTALLAGAIELYRGSSSSINDSRFIRNTATAGSGGAITYDQDKSNTGTPPVHSINACIFDGNAVEQVDGVGGFGSVLLSFNANIELTNALFTNNEAMVSGAIYHLAFDNRQDNINLVNCTFANNDNGDGASLMADNVGTDDTAGYALQNTIFADSGDSFGNGNGEGLVVSNGGNICANASMSNIFTHEKDQPETDPKFKGPEDYSPANDSPAINAGVNTGAPEADLTGFQRDALVDIGAYESREVTDVFNQLTRNGYLTVFPNPVSNRLQLQLQSDWNGPLTVQIRDASGRLFVQRHLDKDLPGLEAKIPTHDLPAGIYLLQLSSGSAGKTVKFIKK